MPSANAGPLVTSNPSMLHTGCPLVKFRASWLAALNIGGLYWWPSGTNSIPPATEPTVNVQSGHVPYGVSEPEGPLICSVVVCQTMFPLDMSIAYIVPPKPH